MFCVLFICLFKVKIQEIVGCFKLIILQIYCWVSWSGQVLLVFFKWMNGDVVGLSGFILMCQMLYCIGDGGWFCEEFIWFVGEGFLCLWYIDGCIDYDICYMNVFGIKILCYGFF